MDRIAKAEGRDTSAWDDTGAWDAVIVAGGQARRLGGVDKPAVEVAGRSLLDRVLDAVDGASVTVVVGPRRPVAESRQPRWALERPPGSGPVAAIAAGLALVTAPRVVVLAADLPFLGSDEVRRLLASTTAAGDDGRLPDAATLVDPAGRVQPLAAAWWTAALREALPAERAGAAVRGLLAGRRVVSVPAGALACHDCDSPEELAWARMRAGTMER